MSADDASQELVKSLPCAAGRCAGPVAPGQTECVSHRLMRPEGRKHLIAELRDEVVPRLTTTPIQVATAAPVAAPPSTLPASTLPPRRWVVERALRPVDDVARGTIGERRLARGPYLCAFAA